MANKKKRSGPGVGGTAVEEPPLPAYDEGHIESIGEGRGQSKDEDPRTGQGLPTDEGSEQDPKLSDNPDAFISSEISGDVDPKKTS